LSTPIYMHIPYSGVLVYTSDSSVYTVNLSPYYALYKRVLDIVVE